MSDSIRIVEMPDLGAVTDSCSVVGEHAGSGLFQATALRSYVLASLPAGDVTAVSFSSSSGIFYAGNNSSSTNFIVCDAVNHAWNVVLGGQDCFLVNGDGSASSTGPFTAGNKLNAKGPTIASLSLYCTSTPWGMGLWVEEAGRLWFGGTDINGGVVAGYGFLAAGELVFTSASVAIVTSGGNLCSGDNANFYVPNHAWKPGGGSWSDTSDARIKDVLGDYISGLEVVMRLRPVRYSYRDNWHFGTTGTADPKLIGQEFVGLVAQQVEHVMPELVSRTVGVIDGEEVDDLRTIDSTPLIYALLNAVQELAGRLAALEAKERNV